MSLLKDTIRWVLALVPIIFVTLFIILVRTITIFENLYRYLFEEGGFCSDKQRNEHFTNVGRVVLNKQELSRFRLHKYRFSWRYFEKQLNYQESYRCIIIGD